jgi:hypothetical protein
MTNTKVRQAQSKYMDWDSQILGGGGEVQGDCLVLKHVLILPLWQVDRTIHSWREYGAGLAVSSGEWWRRYLPDSRSE